MNQLLQLKGEFKQEKNKRKMGEIQFPKNSKLEIAKIKNLRDKLEEIESYWLGENIISGALVSVQYIKIIPKSCRIAGIFKRANEHIVGAKFTENSIKKAHVITYYINKKELNESIQNLTQVLEFLMKKGYNNEIGNEDLKKIRESEIEKKTRLLQTIVDSYYVENFDVPRAELEENEDTLVTVFNVETDIKILLKDIGIDILSNRIIDNTTLLLMPDELKVLLSKAPYLISMGIKDLSELTKEDFNILDEARRMSIPSPRNEPIIGVIDTMFDKGVYFSEWVEFKNMLDENIELSYEDYRHGTAVTSIIVDGPSINPNMNDGCGRFRVRHFGVSTAKGYNSFSILRAISQIVESNKDIKVWNLSLGSTREINANFISPEANILDKIQYENDVIFVVAGTNKGYNSKKDMFIGSPADSINSLVVNSVNLKNESASYSRRGPVLSFFNKPDISYYGGDKDFPITVCQPTGEGKVMGTSYAAPWITRKLAYLINVLKFSRQEAKALLIDAAAGWDKKTENSNVIGFGIVPKDINDIVSSKNDEIKFIISGISEEYHTYTYDLPIPVKSENYPFIVRATLCYFPYCSRNQGIDYTNTEFDFKFGRINEKGIIESIDKNLQDEIGAYIHEEEARKFYRKWDNVKHIKEVYSPNRRERKLYSNKSWGISVKTKERSNKRFGNELTFGMVITLKEINGKNRLDDFVRMCLLRGWLVNKVDIENKINIYNILEETVTLE